MNKTAQTQDIQLAALSTELFTRCIAADNKALVIEKHLGRYRQRFVRTEDGWECAFRTDTTQIIRMTDQIRQFAALYPELKVSYPHKILNDARETVENHEAWVDSEALAVLEVPEAFVNQYSGSDFLVLLKQDWSVQVSALADAVAARLRRYEIRTRQMFGRRESSLHVQCEVTADAICSDIWHLPLSAHGLYPLQGNAELCGMARALAETLSEMHFGKTGVYCRYDQTKCLHYIVDLCIEDSEL